MIQSILILFSSILTSVVGQILLRKAMLDVGRLDINLGNIIKLLLLIFTDGYVFSALVCYGIGFITWMVTLTRLNLSVAFPCLSLGYVFVAIISHILFNEPLGVMKFISIGIICLGVCLLVGSDYS